MRLSRPIVVRPSITQCGPIVVPAPIRTCGADDAVGADLDVVGELGAGLDDRRRVDRAAIGRRPLDVDRAHGAHQLRLGRELAVDAGARR